MSRASVIALAQALANDQADPTSLERYYDDAVTDLAQSTMWMVLEIVTGTPGVAIYDRPARVADLVTVFYDDTMLSLATHREMDALSPEWRTHVGRPTAYLYEDISYTQVQVYPIPTDTGTPVIPVHGAPFGLDYPVGSLAILATARMDDMPVWMDLPLALALLQREYSRPSPHMDPGFAEGCKALGLLCATMVA